MAKVIQNVALDLDNFQWLREEQAGRRQKSLSIAINEILKNYQMMVRSVDKAREHAERISKAQYEAEQLAKTYRSQVVISDAKNKI